MKGEVIPDTGCSGCESPVFLSMPALLKTQKNQVYKLIESVGLSPVDFSWDSEKVPEKCDQLRFQRSDYVLRIELAHEGWVVDFRPAESSPSGRLGAPNWPALSTNVLNWLSYLRREIEAPDFWVRTLRYRFLDQGLLRETFSNEPFSYEHVERVHAAVAAIRDQIAGEFQLTHEALGDVNRRLDYLADASKRLGRFDWTNVAVSTFMNIAVAASVTPERAKALWDTFWGMLKGWLQLPG